MEHLSSLIKPPSVLKDIPWKTLIKQADEIDFLVQGWDSWMKQHYNDLEDFARREGKFNLFVVNPEGPEAALTRQLMAKRLDRTDIETNVEIRNTITTIKDIFSASTNNNKSSQVLPEIYLLNDINWYFAAQFKSSGANSRNALVLSLYSHHKFNTMDTPAIILYKDSAPKVFSWFDAELLKIKNLSAKE